MEVGEICTREVVTVEPQCALLEAAELMRIYHVGDVVVVSSGEGGVEPLGVVTDRDIVIGALLPAPEKLRELVAGDLVNKPLVTVREHESVDQALNRMCEQGVRRAPVIDDHGALVGILSEADLTQMLTARLAVLAGIDERRRLNEEREDASPELIQRP